MAEVGELDQSSSDEGQFDPRVTQEFQLPAQYISWSHDSQYQAQHQTKARIKPERS